MKKIDNIFKDAFEGFEETVDPGLWNAIQGSIPTAASAGAATTGGFLSSVGAKIVAAIVVGAAIVTTVVIINQEPKAELVEAQQEPISKEITSEPDSKEENNTTEIVAEVEFDDLSHPIANNDSEKKIVIIEDYPVSDDTPEKQEVETPEEVVLIEEDPKTATSPENSAQTTEGKNNPSTPTDNTTKDNSSTDNVTVSSDFVFLIPSEESPKYVLFQAEAQEDVRFLWNFGNGQISDEINPSVVYEDFGTYQVTLTVIDEKGNERRTTQELEINLEPIIDIPNIFTPNDDNLNATFDVMAKSENVTLKFLRIMDAKNKVVHMYSEGSHGWDGLNTKGEICPEGQYVYVAMFVDMKGDPIQKTGTVQLVR